MEWNVIFVVLAYEAVACRRLESGLGSRGWESALKDSVTIRMEWDS